MLKVIHQVNLINVNCCNCGGKLSILTLVIMNKSCFTENMA